MSDTTEALLLQRLRSDAARCGPAALAAIGGPLEDAWRQAVAELELCIRPTAPGTEPILHEGGPYPGAWVESTASISTEVLGRFRPEVSRATHLALAAHQRDDGLLPYKVTSAGPGFAQIQMVTPLARSVWRHYERTRDREYLATMYAALSRHDAWLAEHRDTRGTGGVEAFCTYDAGHDRSPRFWGVPNQTPAGDPARYDAHAGGLPYLAPDLTANVACQRSYLARMAAELGDDPAVWEARAAASREALQLCHDEPDDFFYDLDGLGRPVRIQTDVLLRVLACEVLDDDAAASALRRYVLNRRKFYSGYPFTSVAMDDARFDRDVAANSWGGPVNFLTLIRTPDAFEPYGRHAELTAAWTPVLAAVARMGRFPQTMSPWSGEPGYTEQYSPAILWFLDACERLLGITATPDGDLWFTAMTPRRVDSHDVADAVAYSRDHRGHRYETITTADGGLVLRDGATHLRLPWGTRAVTDGEGALRAVVAVSPGGAAGTLRGEGWELELNLRPNERWEIRDGNVEASSCVEWIAPTN